MMKMSLFWGRICQEQQPHSVQNFVTQAMTSPHLVLRDLARYSPPSTPCNFYSTLCKVTTTHRTEFLCPIFSIGHCRGVHKKLTTLPEIQQISIVLGSCGHHLSSSTYSC